MGPGPCCDNAALLPWLAGTEQMLLLYNPDCNSNYSPDPDGDIGGYWPDIPPDLRDMPWVYVVRTGVWQRCAHSTHPHAACALKPHRGEARSLYLTLTPCVARIRSINTSGPLNAYGIPIARQPGGPGVFSPSSHFCGEQLPEECSDSEEELARQSHPGYDRVAHRTRNCGGAVAIIPGHAAGDDTRVFVWSGMHWGPTEQPAGGGGVSSDHWDLARTGLFELSLQGDAQAFARNPDLRVELTSHGIRVGMRR